ncbi:efflux RND transporter permease subunit [Thermosulfurimonas sp. F29]|uniref:efflux RND transporter permease subunit n=1 Tax=Thermosulfurimonas sp. F29 TaxID=2867247 RepID=UPI001C830016|nr:efflux RND transporter permease subunit [Thermosulfurimonas sp. F29]MBX6422837.1 efflux RND transporter permease subunit [Thermosulfurimonas sp. F29]
MRGALRWLIANPRLMLLLVVSIVFTGLYALWHLPVDLFPNLDLPVANIIAHYPGAAPEDIELLITRPIEDELRGLPGVKRISSVSIQGISRVTVVFGPGTSIREARELIQARLARIAGLLPPGVIPRMENIGTTLQEVVGYVVYGSRDLVKLRNLIRLTLYNRLMSIPGVSSVEVLGGDRRAFIVRIRPETLMAMGMGISDLKRALARSNTSQVAGIVTRGGREYVIRGDARLEALEDLKDFYIRNSRGENVPLSSVAEVLQGVVPRHYEVRGDGHPAVAFYVCKQPGASSIEVARAVETAVKEFKAFLPPGTRIKKFYDQSEILEEARKTILDDLLLGAFLAVGVLYLFMGTMGPTLVVSATIPLTLLATLISMKILGLSLNIVTLSALALAVGMIVDDAIVVAENIFRHLEMGEPPAKAALTGTTEIAPPDAAGTFTTVAAFLPLGLVTGILGLFLRPFGLVVSLALLISLLLSLSFVPVLLGNMSLPQKSIHPPAAHLLSSLRSFLLKILSRSLNHPRKTIAGSAVIPVVIGILIFGSFHLKFLPPVDEGALLIEYTLPPGTSLRESNRIGEELVHLAMTEPDVACVYRRTGSPEVGHQIEGVNRGEMIIKLKPRGERTRKAGEIMADLKKVYSRFPGMVLVYHQPTQEKMDESLSGLPALFGVTIYGRDLNILASLAGRVEKIMENEPGISNVVNPLKVKRPQITVKLRYSDLARFGVSPEEVFSTLRAAFWGLEATRIIKPQGEIRVLLQFDRSRISNPRELSSLPIRTSRGQWVPLRKVADIRVEYLPGEITRLNGEREVTLLAEVEGNLFTIASRLKRHLQALSLPGGYRVEITGQYRVLKRSLREMAFILAGALILVFLILLVEFNSWKPPLVILITAPFSLTGALVALWMTRQDLDLSVAMGMLTLIGICVNNAIVLLDFVEQKTKEGTDLRVAFLEAIRIRLRPILLTSLTTIFALMPAAIGLGAGAEYFQGFAIAVMGGLVAATFVSFILVPCLSLWALS